MTAERWRQIERLFQQALERPASEHTAFLREVCQGDEELRSELESLLACDAPDQPLVSIDPEPKLDGGHLGAYRVLRLIGRGGMGAVYLGVRDDDQYSKRVAIKVLKRGMDTEFMLSRFRQERQILANLEHPFIARMMDGGATADGLPYFVMEFVDGVPITTYCFENGLSIPERLRLFRLVCEAVQYAHQNLVVHRDIKPSNILTTKEGVPKLLDFGIAKALGTDAVDATLTRRELRMLTPDYASPEQVQGLPISTATDTYSLGAVLYELLTGQRPLQFPSGSISDIEKTICDTEPDKPSVAVLRSAKIPAAERNTWKRKLAGELDTVVLTALRKEPARRYASVAEFSEDLRRHLEGLPIQAHEDRWLYYTGKYIRRNRLLVGAALLVILSLAAGTWTTTVQARRAERRFMVARRLANTVVAEVNGSMSRIPGATAARVSMIQSVIRYLDDLAKETGDDPSFALEIAHTYRSVAQMEGSPFQQNLGQTEAALINHAKALSILEKVYREAPEGSDYKRRALGGLVGGNIEAGDIESRAGRDPAARARLQKVRALASEASATDPSVLAPGTWIYLYFRLGGAEMRDGAPDRALPHFRKALEICIDWATKDPSTNSRATLRGAYSNLAGAQMRSGDLQAARENYSLALRHIEQVTRKPDSTVFERSALSGAHKNLGDVLGNPLEFNFGDRAGAVMHYRAAVEIEEALHAADPQDVRGRDDLANTYADLAFILNDSRASESLELAQRALRIARELTDAVPSSTKHRQSLAVAQLASAEALLTLRRPQEAIEQFSSALVTMNSLSPVAEDRIEISAWQIRIYHGLGTAYQNLGRDQQALDHFNRGLAVSEETIRQAPSSLYAKRWWADALESLGRYHLRIRPRDESRARAFVKLSTDMWSDWVRRKIALPYSAVREQAGNELLASIRP